MDAAMELTALGHAVHIFTAHHDPKHCFEETTGGNSHLIVKSSLSLHSNLYKYSDLHIVITDVTHFDHG